MTLNFVKDPDDGDFFVKNHVSILNEQAWAFRKVPSPLLDSTVVLAAGVHDLPWSPSRMPFPKIRLFWWLP